MLTIRSLSTLVTPWGLRLLRKCLLPRFACQQRVLKTFPGPDVPLFGNGEVGSWDMSGKFIYIFIEERRHRRRRKQKPQKGDNQRLQVDENTATKWTPETIRAGYLQPHWEYRIRQSGRPYTPAIGRRSKEDKRQHQSYRKRRQNR